MLWRSWRKSPTLEGQTMRYEFCFWNFLKHWLFPVGPWLDTRCPLSHSTTPLRWTGEREYYENLLGWDKDRDRSLTNYWHRQNRLNLGKHGWITNQISKMPFLYPSLLPGFNFASKFSAFYPSAVQREKEWGLWSVHLTLSLPLFPPHREHFLYS